MGSAFFKNLAVGVTMMLCALMAVVSIRLADRASNRADKLGAQVSTQQKTIDMQEETIQRMLSMAGAHQDLIDGILKNQEGIVDLMAVGSKRTRSIAQKR